MRRELVEKARAGDRDAFATLAARVDRSSVQYRPAHARRPRPCRRAVQETLVLAWRDLKGLRVLRVRHLAAPSTGPVCLPRSTSRAADLARADPRGASPAQTGTAEVFEDRDLIERGFRQLRPEYRAALVLHHYLGFSDQDAAAALAVPAGTFKSRLNRATSALRAALDAEARTPARLPVETVR